METLVGHNHIRTIISNLSRNKNLLNTGKDVLPYSQWMDKIQELIDDMKTHLEIEDSNSYKDIAK